MFGRQRASSLTVGESKKALKSYFEEHAQDVVERNWINLEMHATLMNTYPPKLIATLRGQLEENDQLHSVEKIARPIPESPFRIL